MSSLDRFMAWLESRLQGLVEGGTSWLLPGGRQRRELAGWLAEVMQESARRNAHGGWQAPDLYTLTLPTGAANQVDETLLVELASALQAEASRRGLTFSHSPVVRVVADPLGQAARVQVAFSGSNPGDTGTVKVPIQPASLPETSEKVVRGGAWNNEKELLRVYSRGSQPADWCTPQLGFRPAAILP